MLALLLLVAVEPALANRFETVASGFSGSSLAKRTWLERFLVITGGISLFTGILAIVVPHQHAAFLNYGNWKQSALVLFALAGGLWMLALLL